MSAGNRRRVLVTGGSGYVGSSLIRRLQELGIPYLSVDILENITDKNSRVLNLSDAEPTRRIVEDFLPTVVVHCGTLSAAAYRKDFYEAFRTDSLALFSLLDALKTCSAPRLIYFSSNYVYSGIENQIVGEETPLKPSHNFGVAKNFFEEFILRTYSNSIIFRLSSVFGSARSRNPNAIMDMTKECLRTQQLTVWGSGARMMQYVHMDDVIEAILKGEAAPPGLYNLGGQDYTSVSQTAHIIANKFGSRIAFLANKPEGETLPMMDTGKWARASDWRAGNFVQQLNDFLDYARAIGDDLIQS